ncbi:MAG: ATP synthase subunit a [Candidatus Jorgensenbacteria bacterium GW2011_GWA2_45_13]|uniref:ATP synthase subunit a n=1 Tax=Candidatus Jorgensenbacteria bacterium GW2011_GWA2_45_13 TaxID=1618662 RepID=A0A0G1NGQ8_9BACT|nr:MAG: ATP synthase subunit a [Candidatus Jorgensenbacteria bacterium GW2011_GWA2_45_13]
MVAWTRFRALFFCPVERDSLGISEIHMENISLKAETIFHIGAFGVTNSLFLGVVVLVVLVILGLLFKKNLSFVPGKMQNLFEAAAEGLLGLMASVLGSEEKAEKYFPFIANIFLVILVSNWFGLIPGVGTIGFFEGAGHTAFVPFFRAPSADLNFTLAVAIIAVFAVNLFGVLAIGFWKHLGKFFSLKNPIHTFVGFLEFISEIAKMISFSFRLFGNIFAGEVLLIIVGFLVPYIVPLPFMFLEIFVGFIQAFVFAMLTLVFISIATTEMEHA